MCFSLRILDHKLVAFALFHHHSARCKNHVYDLPVFLCFDEEGLEERIETYFTRLRQTLSMIER